MAFPRRRDFKTRSRFVADYRMRHSLRKSQANSITNSILTQMVNSHIEITLSVGNICGILFTLLLSANSLVVSLNMFHNKKI